MLGNSPSATEDPQPQLVRTLSCACINVDATSERQQRIEVASGCIEGKTDAYAKAMASERY